MLKYLLVGLALLSYLRSDATTYYVSAQAPPGLNGLSSVVSDNQTGPFNLIQKALDQVKNGDKIYLMGGQYYERLTLRSKENITIKSFGDEKVVINGTLNKKDHSGLKWELLRTERNSTFNNTQYIFRSKLPDSFIRYNAKKPAYTWYRNYVFINNQMLWAYKSMAEFKDRKVADTNGEASFFEKDYVYIALNTEVPPDDLGLTFSDYVWWLGSLKNFTLDGGENKNITIQKSGNIALYISGYINDLNIKNVNFIDVVKGFYIGQTSGSGIQLDQLNFENRSRRNTNYLDYKRSYTMQQSAINYVNSKLDKLTVKNCKVKNTFYGFTSANANAHFKNNTMIGCAEGMTIEGTVENNILEGNKFIDCTVAVGLVCAQVGPVYVFDNLFFSSKDTYWYGSNGEVKKQSRIPLFLKFWNAPNGKGFKNSKKVNVSTNCHFYYNTFISPRRPLSIGAYNNQYLSPTNSTVYNNIFISEKELTYSTGFASDGIEIQNNVFFSKRKNLDDKRLFIGWDGSQHFEKLSLSSNWVGNNMIDLKYDLKIRNSTLEKFKFSRCSNKKLRKFKTKKLPLSFPNASILNERDKPGSTIKL